MNKTNALIPVPGVAKPRIIIVDDHPEVLRQVAESLAAHFEILHTLQAGTEVLATVQNSQPDLILLDISLPETCGLQIARQLRQINSPARIVFLTVLADPDYAREAFAIGACGYVIKSRLCSDLLPALHAALSGNRFVSPCPELADLA